MTLADFWILLFAIVSTPFGAYITGFI